MNSTYYRHIAGIAAVALFIGCGSDSSSTKTPTSGGMEVEAGGATAGSGGAMTGGVLAPTAGRAVSGGNTTAGGSPTAGGQAAGGAPNAGGSASGGSIAAGGQIAAGQPAGGQAAGGAAAGGAMAGGEAMGGMMTPEFVPEVDCVDDAGCALSFQRCVQNKCAFDLRPDVFKLSEVAVTQPMNSAPVLQAALSKALTDNLLNLLIEPGGYKDAGYRWYVGNAGRFEDGTYDYFKTADGTNLYPVQNFDGVWRQSEGVAPHWTLEGDTVFVLNVPTSTVMVDGVDVSCFVTFNVNVTLMMTPMTNADTMAPYVEVSITGILRKTDIMDVSIPVNGVEVTLLDVLSGDMPSIDTDGDGDLDAYPFVLTGKATKIQTHENFEFPRADGSNRSPMAMENPEACGN